MPDFSRPERELIFADFKDAGHASQVAKELKEHGVKFEYLMGEGCDVLRIRERARDYGRIRLDLWYSPIALLYRELETARRRIGQIGYGHYGFGAAVRLRDPSGAPLVAIETINKLDVEQNERFLFLPDSLQLLDRRSPFEVEDPASAMMLSGLAVVLQHKEKP